jgi:sugar diacid utilization regulator/GAF domain-containing protein
MTTITHPRPRSRPAAQRSAPEPREPAAVLTAVADIAAAASGCTELDDLLRIIAARAAAAIGVRRCGAYLRDGDKFVGRASHPTGQLEADVRRQVAGGPADAFTRELVDTGAPVFIRDTHSDPRGGLSALRSWHVNSSLGIPLLHDDEVIGALFLDNADEPHAYTEDRVATAVAIGRAAGAAVAQLQRDERARSQLETATRQNLLLRRLASADSRFTQLLLDGGGLRAIVEVLAEMTGKSAALYDVNLRRVASVPGADGGPEVELLEQSGASSDVVQAMRDTAPGGSTAIAPVLTAGMRRRHLVAPVDVGRSRWGWVVLMEHPARLTPLDELTIRRAARCTALEVAAERRATTAAWDARTLLARQLIRGTQDEDVRRSAEHLAIDLEQPRVVGFVTGVQHRGGSIDAQRLVAALSEQFDGEVLATKGPEGVAIIVDLPEAPAPLAAVRRAKRGVLRACAEVGGPTRLIAGLSSVCRGPETIPRGYREARQVARCVDRFVGPGTQAVLCADDLGPGRLFVATGEQDAIDRFVGDVVGPLLSDEAGLGDLLRTLQAYFDTGRSVRLSAARLGVHENTIRYRLARVGNVTGLDVVGNPDDQLSVQMSLLVLRLQGHPALPAFDEDDEDDAATAEEAA